LRIPRGPKLVSHQTMPHGDHAEGFVPAYNPINPTKDTLRKPPKQATMLDLHSVHADLIIHTFTSSGPKSRPIRIEVNGRQGRRVACVLYSDQKHLEFLDIDSHRHHDEGDNGDTEETTTEEAEEMQE
jgi:hypothetical protein